MSSRHQQAKRGRTRALGGLGHNSILLASSPYGAPSQNAENDRPERAPFRGPPLRRNPLRGCRLGDTIGQVAQTKAGRNNTLRQHITRSHTSSHNSGEEEFFSADELPSQEMTNPRPPRRKPGKKKSYNRGPPPPSVSAQARPHRAGPSNPTQRAGHFSKTRFPNSSQQTELSNPAEVVRKRPERSLGKQPARPPSPPYVSPESSFNDGSILFGSNPSTAPTSFNENCSPIQPLQSLEPAVEEDDEIPTDIDEFVSVPEPCSDLSRSRSSRSLTPEYDERLEELRQEQLRQEKERLELLNCKGFPSQDYIPHEEEDQLAELRQDFFGQELDVGSEVDPQLSSYGVDDVSVSDYSVSESLVAELSRLDLGGLRSPILRPSPLIPSPPVSPARGGQPRRPTLPFERYPFWVQHELTRVSQFIGASAGQMARVAALHSDALCNAESKTVFWNLMKSIAQDATGSADARKLAFPPVMNDNAWDKLHSSQSWPNELELNATATYSSRSPTPDFELRLNPPEDRYKANRLSCRFGSDRFLMVRLPGMRSSEQHTLPPPWRGLDNPQLRSTIVNWLVRTELSFLGREWRCFYAKQDAKKRKDSETGVTHTDKFVVALFFAQKGLGLGRTTMLLRQQLRLEVDRTVNRDECSRDELLKWCMPIEKHMDDLAQTVDLRKRSGVFAKLWSRITLGLSNSRPTVKFDPKNIYIVDDITSPGGNVMGDGCSVCSPYVLRKVREILDLEENPSAVQGRIGGAKGVWFADPTADPFSKDLWVKIVSSQLKYQFHDEDRDADTADWARCTLFVLNWSKEPAPANLNLQLVPILKERGVPFEVFRDVLDEHLETDLEGLLQSARDRPRLRNWLHQNGMGGERVSMGEILQTESGFPYNFMEEMAMLLDAGFDPMNCQFLMDRLRRIVEQACENVVDHLHTRVPQTCVVYCVADPTGTLNEGEISLQFSKGFVEQSGNRLNFLFGDVLVGRNPAHLPSDIRKVRAVSPAHIGLQRLYDVVVFSTKGEIPLGSILSGGDYDGDKIWICWDRRFVDSFRNYRVSVLNWDEPSYFQREEMPPTVFNPNMARDGFFDDFFRRGFQISMQDSLLGMCTSTLEAYAYNRQWKIDRTLVLLAKFCGSLADAQKQGFVPTEAVRRIIWEAMRQSNAKPCYKNPRQGAPEGPPESWYFLDRLVFEVAKNKADEKMKKFDELRSLITYQVDPDLTARYHWWVLQYPELRTMMIALERSIRKIHDEDWVRGNRTSSQSLSEFASFVSERLPPVIRKFNAILPSPEAHHGNLVVEFLRKTAEEPWSAWKLLRASTCYYLYQKGSKMPWWLAAPELCKLKAVALEKRGATPARVIDEGMYYILRPNSRLVMPAEEEAEE